MRTQPFGRLPLMAFPPAWRGDRPEPRSEPVERVAPPADLPVDRNEFLRLSGVDPDGPVDEVF